MFPLTVLNLPPQYTPIIVARAQLAPSSTYNRIVGVCQPVENPPNQGMPPGKLSEANEIGPAGAASLYFSIVEHTKIDANGASASVLQGPKHGILKDSGDGSYWYLPNSRYFGTDSVIFRVHIGGLNVKVVYGIHVVREVLDSTGSQECPNPVWKIAAVASDGGDIPTSAYLALTYTIRSPGVNLGVANIRGETGKGDGNAIKLDANGGG